MKTSNITNQSRLRWDLMHRLTKDCHGSFVYDNLTGLHPEFPSEQVVRGILIENVRNGMLWWNNENK